MSREPPNHQPLLRGQGAPIASTTCTREGAAPTQRILGRLGLLGLLTFSACTDESATPDDCDAILTRIIELEIREQGYRDPALVERKQTQLRHAFADEIGRCVGRRLPQGAMECITTASSAEQVSHRCLR